MDVFLSGADGDFNNLSLKNALVKSNNQATTDKIYFQYAIKSIIDNPKETVLSWMQKFESHLISIQKVPNLPGGYVYNSQDNSIKIMNDRLTWTFVFGNLIYELYRFTLLVMGLIVIGMYMAHNRLGRNFKISLGNFSFIFLFWAFSLVPAMLFYSETRFKIVQEVTLFPLIFVVLDKLSHVRKHGISQHLG